MQIQRSKSGSSKTGRQHVKNAAKRSRRRALDVSGKNKKRRVAKQKRLETKCRERKICRKAAGKATKPLPR